MLTVPTSGGPWIFVDCGLRFCMAINQANVMVCWGNTAFTHNLCNFAAGVSNSDWKYVDVGDYNACGVKTTGRVVCWGSIASNPPLHSDYVHVSVGKKHACGTRSNFAIACKCRVGLEK